MEKLFLSLSPVMKAVVALGVLTVLSIILLVIFFKAPVKEGGVYGGLESIRDPEEREAMRRYLNGLDPERPVIGKEKKSAAKARAVGSVSRGELLDAEFETVSEEEIEEEAEIEAENEETV